MTPAKISLHCILNKQAYIPYWPATISDGTINDGNCHIQKQERNTKQRKKHMSAFQK